MPSINPIYDPEQERIIAQLKLADALRQQGMTAKAVGSGGAGMVGNLFVKGNQMGNLAQVLGGAGLDAYARNQADKLGASREAERQQFMAEMPSGVDTQRYDPVANPGTGPLVDGMEVPTSPRALAQATQQWAARAPRGMEGVQNFALQQAMTAPQRQAEQEYRAQEARALAEQRAEAAAALQGERIQAQAERAQEANALRMTLAQMAAANRPAPAPHTQIAYGPDGKGYMVDMRTGAQTPLESIGKVPGAGGAGATLPIQAQKLQSSLQNLESGLNAYETLLKQYNPQNMDALTPEKRAALSSAFGDLRMQLKGAYELGAITGPDMQVLEGVLTDPTGPLGMAKGAIRGNKTFDAQITQTRAALERQKRNFEQQYKVELPAPAGTATAPMPGVAPTGFKVLGVRDK